MDYLIAALRLSSLVTPRSAHVESGGSFHDLWSSRSTDMGQGRSTRETISPPPAATPRATFPELPDRAYSLPYVDIQNVASRSAFGPLGTRNATKIGN